MSTESDIFLNTVKFSLSNYYKEWKPYLLKVLKTSRSRLITCSPKGNLALQLLILKDLADIENTIGIQQSELGMAKSQGNVVYNQRLRHILKD